jgi:hypothetical protein
MADIIARTQTAVIGQLSINLELLITFPQHPRQCFEEDLSDELQMDDEPDFDDEGNPEYN